MDAEDDGAAGRIRKRRFSSARIQPTRIKKVMQSDEEIGRMIASVPVAIGSAMEHFAEKVLESAAQCVQYSSARTLTPTHIRYAILKNPHFSFLQELTKDIPTPRLEDTGQTTTPLPAMPTTNLGPVFANVMPQNFQFPHFQNPQSFPETMVSNVANYDLNINTPLQRPVQLLKDQIGGTVPTVLKSHTESNNASNPRKTDSTPSSSTLASPNSSENPSEPVKRKRGRPRKERKEKFVETSNAVSTPNDANGQGVKTPEERDRLLMPPPALLGRRSLSANKEAVGDENSANCTSPPTTNSSTKTSLTAM